MTFTGYITVRLNSVRVPRKSIKTIGGSTLVNTAVKKLNSIKAVEKIYLYCSDEKIQNYIDPDLSYNYISRPKKFDGDYTTFNDILDSIIDKIDTDYIVFLSVTSPFIKESTIEEMVESIKTGRHDSSFLAYKINNFCWFKGKPLNYSLKGEVQRTQDLEPVIVENSGLYIFSKKDYKEHKRRIGINPFIKTGGTIESWDIDTFEELEIAKILGNK
jgi:CMP-N-acetylneuraminic acid synthetase|tara:strand:+ start:2767 stop:3414 length:648 start_codon:yes stop_codon:yes gene_type:complete